MSSSNTKAINQPFVDLSSVLGHQSLSRNILAAKLIEQCLQTLDRYPQVGLTAFRQDWHRFDLSYGQSVTLQIPQSPTLKKEPLKTGQKTTNTLIENKEYIIGTACGIDDQGALLLQVGHQKRRYVCGEVSLRL
jgi:BirA family biotin operon repressor/biotin-[acetyl-CoA-carboxylase] ligase